LGLDRASLALGLRGLIDESAVWLRSQGFQPWGVSGQDGLTTPLSDVVPVNSACGRPGYAGLILLPAWGWATSVANVCCHGGLKSAAPGAD